MIMFFWDCVTNPKYYKMFGEKILFFIFNNFTSEVTRDNFFSPEIDKIKKFIGHITVIFNNNFINFFRIN